MGKILTISSKVPEPPLLDIHPRESLLHVHKFKGTHTKKDLTCIGKKFLKPTCLNSIELEMIYTDTLYDIGMYIYTVWYHLVNLKHIKQ